MAKNEIEFSITARDNFSKVMGSASKAMKSFAGVLKKATVSVVAAGGSILGFTALVAKNIDVQAKFAKRIGVSVKELTTLQFAASQAGISTEQFNMATQRMTRRVAEAAKGTGEAKGALQELGISATEFSRLSLDEQYVELAGAMEKVQSPSDQLRLAFKLFDSEGTAVLQMLKGGSESMRALAADADFLGLAISEQAAANSEAFSDSLGRATGSLKGLSNGIAGELMPILTGLNNRFADFIADNREGIANFTKGVVKAGFVAVEVFSQIAKTIKGVFTNISDLEVFRDNVINVFINLGEAAFNFGKLFVEYIKTAFSIAFDNVKIFASNFGKAIISAIKGEDVNFADVLFKSFDQSVENAKSKLSELKEPALEVVSSLSDTGIGEALGINLDLAKQKAEETMAAIAEVGEVTKQNIQQTGEAQASLFSIISEQYQTWQKANEEYTAQFAENFFNIIDGTITNISAGMADALVEGKNMADTMKNIGKQFFKAMIANLIELGVRRLIFSKLARAATIQEGISGIGAGAAKAYANAYASTAAIPIVGPGLAPAAAALAGAGASKGGIALMGMAHDGLTNVPREGTYLLNQGERVLSPNQNSDLTSFLNGGGGGGSTVIENIDIHILENASNADALLNMDKTELERLVAGPIIDALNSLDKDGVRPVFAERG